MTAKFIVEEGPSKGLVFSLKDNRQWIFGRDPDSCSFVIEDASVSRKQLACYESSEGITAENLSSTNPSLLNGKELISPVLLNDNDLIKIGNTTLHFYNQAENDLEEEAEPLETIIRPPLNTPLEETLHGFEEDVSEKTPLDETPDIINNELNKETTEQPLEQLRENMTTMEDDDTHNPQNANPQEGTPQESNQQEANPIEAEEEKVQKASEDTTSEDNPSSPDTIFDEETSTPQNYAEINFGFLDSGRWMLKVVAGPNNGAEFLMQAGSDYLIGTDPNTCDIVFQDSSVSRQHLRISITAENTLTLEDLNSRNGTTVDGIPIRGKNALTPNDLISIGTTSFTIFDREGVMDTIATPLMPTVAKPLPQEGAKTEGETSLKDVELPNVIPSSAKDGHTPSHTLGAFILIAILTGVFIVIGIGTSNLFKSEPLPVATVVDAEKLIKDALSHFPNIKYTYNKSSGQLMLVGHVLTAYDRNQLISSLQGLRFIKYKDDTGIVIDEYVWKDINQSLEGKPEWKGVTVVASKPGHFVVSGFLKTRAQAYNLADFLSANFPYPHLLDNQVIVEEDLASSIDNILYNKGFRDVSVSLSNGEVTLSGSIPAGEGKTMQELIPLIQAVRGIRTVYNNTIELTPEKAITDISKQYNVSGTSKQGNEFSAVINGRILMKGDQLDGMTITSIQPSLILLEKDGVQYRIEFGSSQKK